MYIHIGQNKAILQRELVGIFDIETTSVSKETRAFLQKSQVVGRVQDVCAGDSPYEMALPKSFLITREKAVYVSPISPATLKKRNNRT